MSDLASAFDDRTDGALRILALLDSVDYEFGYIRDDVERFPDLRTQT